MATGRICEFDIEGGNWGLYSDRLEMYFRVNGVADEMKMPTLITMMGDAAYELLANLAAPTKPSELEYKRAIKIKSDHLNPKRSVLSERYLFRQRKQKECESIQQYTAQLKRLARTCEFGDKLDENLRDQFVCGIYSEVIRQQLFAAGTIAFQDAVTQANSLEMAVRDAATVEKAAGVAGMMAGHAGVTGAQPVTSRRSIIDEAMNRMVLEGCSVCGDNRHRQRECKYIHYECSRCGKRGHLRRMCPGNSNRSGLSHSVGGERARGKFMPTRGRGGTRDWAAKGRRGGGSGQQATAYWVKQDGVEDYSGQQERGTNGEDDVTEEPVYQMTLTDYKPVRMRILVNGVDLCMEIDTGSPISCISYKEYIKCFKRVPLKDCNLSVKFYNGSSVKPLGYLEVDVLHKGNCKKLELYVFESGMTNLLGRQWLAELDIPIPQLSIHKLSPDNLVVVDKVQRNNIVNDVLSRYKELFDGGLGCFTGGRATLRLRQGAEPIFCRARPLPYSLRVRVDAELDAMLRAGVIEPVDCSDWATPLVIVHKPDGALRLCADYKATLNKVLRVDKYPVPKVDDLFSKLSGSRFFTKLDLSQAYNQILLDETRDLTVINTHRGLFKYNRLVYGLASSPAIFQRIMNELFKNIPNVTVFLDDILINHSSLTSHLATIEKVLNILKENGLKIKRQKCEFLATEVKYLGFIISKDGIQVDPDKVKSIIEVSPPTNISELKSFLGMINFYGKFIKNLSTHIAPLYKLLQKGERWNWNEEKKRAFKYVKKLLISSEVLVHYDESKSLILTCDASSRGVGAVLAQVDNTGQERVVAYASRALTRAECNYSQIHKEALAIVFSVKKFHQYLYGRHFVIRSDHKPLVSIFGPEHGIPSMTASRLQRWALLLSAYSFSIEYINTEANVADALSRLIESYKTISIDKEEENEPEQTYLHFASEALLLDFKSIKTETSKDPILSRILSYIIDGWPNSIDRKEFGPYFNRRLELYTELGCIMWGHRLVVPKTCRDFVLRELHDTHMGIVKTKSIARSYVWWPGIDEAIEVMCKECRVCAVTAEAPPHNMPQPWPYPSHPWTRIHLDFLGPIGGLTYLVLVDACSKWVEIFKMKVTNASAVIATLRETWARFGLPRQVVSDNGPPFSSEEFNLFLVNNGIQHTYSAPYHPASNGAAENAVKNCKRVIKKAITQGVNVDIALQRYLLMYRNTEHSTTGESPARILQGRSLRIRLDRLKPARDERVQVAQQRQQRAAGGTLRTLQPGARVWYRSFRGNSKWLEGKVLGQVGSTDYQIRTLEGTEIHRHIDQLKLIKNNTGVVNDGLRGPITFPRFQGVAGEESLTGSGSLASKEVMSEGASDEGGSGQRVSEMTRNESSQSQSQGELEPPIVNLERRNPARIRRCPKKYGFEV